jgi:ParB/RepB/Spo0J family partition protein
VRTAARSTELLLSQIHAHGNIRPSLGSIDELTKSVQRLGILNPITVSLIKGTKRYQLIAGFRRFAAAQAAGLESVPVRVLDLTPAQIAEARLIENIQRLDMDPVSVARALRQYIRLNKLSQEDAAEFLGKSDAWVSLTVRLLDLPKPVLSKLSSGKLSTSHGQALLVAPPRSVSRLAQWCVDKDVGIEMLKERIAQLNRLATDGRVASGDYSNWSPGPSLGRTSRSVIEYLQRAQAHLTRLKEFGYRDLPPADAERIARLTRELAAEGASILVNGPRVEISRSSGAPMVAAR